MPSGAGGPTAGARRPDSGPPATALSRAFDDWLRQPRARHALALSLLGLLTLGNFWELLTASRAHIDEVIYSRAFRAVQDGRSPYDVDGFYYPTAFAFLGAWLDAKVGAAGTRGGFRAANVLALIAALWMTTAWWGRSTGTSSSRAAGSEIATWIERLIIAALLILVSPGVAEGFHVGNLSFVASALAIAALTFAGRRPVVAGTSLALSLSLKPLAVAVLPLLVLTPPRSGARQHRVAGLVAGAMTAVVWLGFPYSWQLLGQKIEQLGVVRTWSLYRLAGVLELGIHRLVIFAAVVTLALAVASRARGSREGWLIVAFTAAVGATPLLWFHTLILYFPALVMAASLARRRWPARKRRPGAWIEPVFVVLGIATVLYYNAGAIDLLPAALEALLLVIPIAAVVWLAAYVLRFGGELTPGAGADPPPARPG